jgi:hypothetical protein
VSERAGGVPLFVEEVTRLILERGVEDGSHAIPPTLQQSLAARLDRLGPAREVAQIGAVLLRAAARRGGGRRPRPRARPGTARRGRHPVRRGRAAAGELSVQARADPGCGLREPAPEPPAVAASPRRREAARRGRRARGDRISFHRGGSRRSRHRMAGQGRRPGAAPLGRSLISARRSRWRTRRQPQCKATRPS